MEIVSNSNSALVRSLSLKDRAILMQVISLAKPSWVQYHTIRAIRDKVAPTEQEHQEHLEERDGHLFSKNDGYVAAIEFTPAQFVYLTEMLKAEVARVAKLDNPVEFFDNLFPVIEALGVEV